MLAATTRRNARSNQGSVDSHTVGQPLVHVDGGGHGFRVELVVLFLKSGQRNGRHNQEDLREKTYLGSTTSFEQGLDLVGVLCELSGHAHLKSEKGMEKKVILLLYRKRLTAFQTLDKMVNFSPISPMSAIDLSMIGRRSCRVLSFVSSSTSSRFLATRSSA